MQVASSFGLKTWRLSDGVVPSEGPDTRDGTEETVTGTGTVMGTKMGIRIRAGTGTETKKERRAEGRERGEPRNLRSDVDSRGRGGKNAREEVTPTITRLLIVLVTSSPSRITLRPSETVATCEGSDSERGSEIRCRGGRKRGKEAQKTPGDLQARCGKRGRL